MCHLLNLFFIHFISQRLILRIYFWKKFYWIPDVIESIDITDRSALSGGISNLPDYSISDSMSEKRSDRSSESNDKSPSEEKCKSFSNFESDSQDANLYPLNANQSQQLKRRYIRCHPQYLSPRAHRKLSQPGAFEGLRIHTDELQEVIARTSAGTLSHAIVSACQVLLTVFEPPSTDPMNVDHG